LACAAACAVAGVGGIALLYLLPGLLLVSVLLAGRYPGEVVLTRRLRAADARSWSRSASRLRVRVHFIGAPRGGLLMGFALAVRPPPLSLIAH